VLQNQYAREIEEMKHVYQEKIDSLSKECENEVTGKYHVIVGAFKTPSYARQYADKIASLGYSTQIIDYRNEFQLVSAGSAMNLKNAKAQLELLRDNVSVNAWIHVN
ncbi:MAG: SPOR domain-containing protein, partial [Bacteroidota bacterium]